MDMPLREDRDPRTVPEPTGAQMNETLISRILRVWHAWRDRRAVERDRKKWARMDRIAEKEADQ